MEDTASAFVRSDLGSLPSYGIARQAFLEWLLPSCETATAALLYPKSDRGLSPGWVNSAVDVERAVAAFCDNRLASEAFHSATKDGVPYTIRGAQRLGLVPHRDGKVSVFCVDLDDHTGDGGNVHLQSAIGAFFGAEPICFTSKSGRGRHLFFRLRTPWPIDDFVTWARSWGFNRTGQPELFPKTAKRTQLWLPNEPNDHGGDRHVGGTFESCLVGDLASPPNTKLSNTTLEFLRGCVPAGDRNNRLNRAAFELGAKRMPEEKSRRLCQNGARLCGLEADDAAGVLSTFESGYRSGSAATPDQGGTQSSRLYSLNGIGNGERFRARYGRRARYCYELKQWMVWTGRRWSLAAEHRVLDLPMKSGRSKQSVPFILRRVLYGRASNVYVGVQAGSGSVGNRAEAEHSRSGPSIGSGA